MRGAVRAMKNWWLPQGVSALLALLLIINVAYPNISVANGTKPMAKSTVAEAWYSAPMLKSFAFARVPSRPSHHAPLLRLAAPPAQPSVDCSTHPCIALSFDDGPNPATTPQIVRTLLQHHAQASFFVVGRNVAGNEQLIRQMAQVGFEIGNHTWSHPDMTQLTPDQIQDQLLRTQTAIAATGAPLPTLFRPPYGAIAPDVVASAGLQVALWNEDPRDWQSNDATALAANIVATARPGGVVDLHDIHQVTADALPSVLDQLNARGYQFVTVSQLMHSRNRPGHDPFYGYKFEANNAQ